MTTNYQKIKEIFSGAIEKQCSTEIAIKNYSSKTEYIKDVYERITKERYADMKTDALKFLNISHSELDKMLIEIICSNLCCDFSLILQILTGKGKRRELYIEDYARMKNEGKTTKERIKRRLEPDRIGAMEELGLIYRDERFKSPTLMKAYKDIMFVQREGNDTIYLSDVFIDIFRALLCDTNENIKDDLYVNSIRDIRAYRLWKFTPDTIKYVVDIYKEIVEGDSDYKIAELTFMEKLFGLITLGEITARKFKKEEAMCVAEGMSLLYQLGYSSMTKLIASRINYKNHHIYSDIITEYIYPLCSACICAILGDVITYIGRIESKERVNLVDGLVKVCHKNAMQIYDVNVLKNIRSNCKMYLFKMLHEIPPLKQIVKDNEEDFSIYLKSMAGGFECEYSGNGKETMVFVVNNSGYEDLSYLQWSNVGNYYEEPTDEDIKKYSKRKT